MVYPTSVESEESDHASAMEAFERRMTLRLYAVGVGIVAAVALLRHFRT
jgi:hypothetical protein